MTSPTALLLLLILLVASQGSAEAPADPRPVSRVARPDAPELPRLPGAIEALIGRTGLAWPEGGALDETTCRALVGWQGELATCRIDALAHGTAACVTIQTECGGDACSWESWLFSAGKDEPTRDCPEALTRDHRIGFSTWTDDLGSEGESLTLSRRDMRTGKTRVLGHCISATLSPAEKWVLCRDRSANVLRVHVRTGRTQLVARSGFRARDIYWRPQWYDVPTAVWFRDGRVHFVVQPDSDLRPDAERIERSVAWRE